jgi:O-antigen/teichoic acid export membrane protein
MNSIRPSIFRSQKKNILSIWANRLLIIFIPLITTPIILNNFGLEVMGVWVLAGQIVSYIGLFDGGLTNSLTRLLAKVGSASVSYKKSEVAATSFYFLLSVSVILLIAMPFAVRYICLSYKFPVAIQDKAFSLFYLAFTLSIFSMPLKVGFGLLGSEHRFDIVQYIDSIGALIRLILIVGMFKFFSPSILHLGLVVFGVSFAVTFVTFLIALNYNKQSIFDFHRISFRILRTIFSMSLSAFFVTLSAAILFQGTIIISGKIIGLEAVSLLAIPVMILNTLTPFYNTFPVIVAPIAAKVVGGDDRSQLLSSYIVITRYIFMCSSLMFLLFYFFGLNILSLWLLGEKITNLDILLIYKSTLILISGFTLGSIGPMGRSILSSVGKHWIASAVEFMTSLFAVFAGFLLAKIYDLNVFSMAWGIFACFVLRGLYFYPKLTANFFEISSLTLLFETKIKPILVFLTCYILWVLIKEALDFTALFSTMTVYIFSCSICLFLFFMGSWKYLLVENHKRYLNKKADFLFAIYKSRK